MAVAYSLTKPSTKRRLTSVSGAAMGVGRPRDATPQRAGADCSTGPLHPAPAALANVVLYTYMTSRGRVDGLTGWSEPDRSVVQARRGRPGRTFQQEEGLNVGGSTKRRGGATGAPRLLARRAVAVRRADAQLQDRRWPPMTKVVTFPSPGGPQSKPKAPALATFRQVDKVFANGVVALAGVDLEIRRASSCRCSARRAAASRRCCGCSPA